MTLQTQHKSGVRISWHQQILSWSWFKIMILCLIQLLLWILVNQLIFWSNTLQGSSAYTDRFFSVLLYTNWNHPFSSVYRQIRDCFYGCIWTVISCRSGSHLQVQIFKISVNSIRLRGVSLHKWRFLLVDSSGFIACSLWTVLNAQPSKL